VKSAFSEFFIAHVNGPLNVGFLESTLVSGLEPDVIKPDDHSFFLTNHQNKLERSAVTEKVN
jgi:hypothetical protein